MTFANRRLLKANKPEAFRRAIVAKESTVTDDLQARLASLKFVPDFMGGMRCTLETGIVVFACTHPFYGLVLHGSHFDGRRAIHFEKHLSETVTRQQIAQYLIEIYESVNNSR